MRRYKQRDTAGTCARVTCAGWGEQLMTYINISQFECCPMHSDQEPVLWARKLKVIWSRWKGYYRETTSLSGANAKMVVSWKLQNKENQNKLAVLSLLCWSVLDRCTITSYRQGSQISIKTRTFMYVRALDSHLNLSSRQSGPDNRAQRSEGYSDLNKYNYNHHYYIPLWSSVTDIKMHNVIDFLSEYSASTASLLCTLKKL